MKLKSRIFEMNKKALAMQALVVIFLLIAVAFILYFVFVKPFGDDSLGTNKEICKLSLAAVAKTKLPLGESPFSINCPRSYLTVHYNEVKGKDGNVDEEKVFKIIQREFYSCYKMIPTKGEGQVPDPFTIWQGEHSICIICTIINFDEEIQKRRTNLKEVDGKGFYEWLIDSYVPGTREYPQDPEKESMYKNLYGVSPSDEVRDNARTLDREYPIDPSKPHVIYSRWNVYGVLDYFARWKAVFCLLSKNKDGNSYCKSLMINFAPLDRLSEDMIYVDEEELKQTNERLCTVLWN